MMLIKTNKPTNQQSRNLANPRKRKEKKMSFKLQQTCEGKLDFNLACCTRKHLCSSLSINMKIQYLKTSIKNLSFWQHNCRLHVGQGETQLTNHHHHHHHHHPDS
jgi:hypothetical protein